MQWLTFGLMVSNTNLVALESEDSANSIFSKGNIMGSCESFISFKKKLKLVIVLNFVMIFLLLTENIKIPETQNQHLRASLQERNTQTQRHSTRCRWNLCRT